MVAGPPEPPGEADVAQIWQIISPEVFAFYVPAFFSFFAFPSADTLLLFLSALQMMFFNFFFFGWLSGDPRILFKKEIE